MCRDALAREESCGGHFREEHQTPEGEALRHDDDFSYVAAWQYNGENQAQTLIKEDLKFDYVKCSGAISNETDLTCLETEQRRRWWSLQKFTRDNVSPDSSFLKMLDGLNEELIESGQEPIAFDHDCREGFVDRVHGH